MALPPTPTLIVMAESQPMIESLSRARRRQQRNRLALMDAARRLFAGRGFDATTIADIAEGADLGFGTFYLYFPSKDAILEAVLDDGMDEIAGELEAEDVQLLPADQALFAVSRRYIALIRNHRDLLTLTGQHLPRRGRRGRPLAELLSRLFKGIIERGIIEGTFTVADAAIAARAITGMHIQLLFAAERDADRQALAETLPALALGGLRYAGAIRRQET